MFSSAYDFKSFYNSREGRVVRRVLRQHIAALWDDLKGLQVLGCGYALPYLRMFMEQGASAQAMMPASMGAHSWPHNEKNVVFCAHSVALPVETNSLDRVVMIHDLEFAEFMDEKLQEAWRVLKSNGRLLVIVPNRGGLWARLDWSPFGHGVPFSLRQLQHRLRENMFVQEASHEVLFMPPIKLAPVLKAAGFFEWLGSFLPFGAGLHMVEVSKQLYARATPSSGSKALAGARGSLFPKPVPASRSTSHKACQD